MQGPRVRYDHHGKIGETLRPRQRLQQADEFGADHGNGRNAPLLDFDRVTGTPRRAAPSAGDAEDRPVDLTTKLIEHLRLSRFIFLIALETDDA